MAGFITVGIGSATETWGRIVIGARSGAELAAGEAVNELQVVDGRFAIATSLRALNGERVILTSGGQSYPGSGTTGDGYRFAANLGHRIVPPRPAHVPLTTNVPWVA